MQKRNAWGRLDHRAVGVTLALAIALLPAAAHAGKPPATTVTAHSAVQAVGSRAADLRISDSHEDASLLQDLPTTQEPEHKALSLGLAGGVFGVLYGYTYLAWYLRSDESPTFQVHEEGWFGVDTYAGGADKVGHAWGNYALVRGVSGILEWGGWNRTMALTTATGMTTAFFVMSEIKDGYAEDYGFSWGDVIANVTGASLGVLMELSPSLDRRFDFRLEYFPSKPFRDAVSTKGPFNSPEDYTGQRFYLAYHLSTIDSLRESRLFGWSEYVDVAVGFHAAHYKPEDQDTADHQQELFMGVSLNLQRVVDKAFAPPPGSNRKRSTGSRALHYTTEIVQMPFTSLQVGGVSRSIPDPKSVPTP